MTPKQFTNQFLPDAMKAESEFGIPATCILTQAAVESGWGKAAPGNNFFGITDTNGVNGDEQLIRTTEYHETVNVKYPVVHSITPMIKNGKKVFKYSVERYFKKYPTPYDAFAAYCKLIKFNNRYKKAMAAISKPDIYLAEVCAAGYATDPSYNKLLQQVHSRIKSLV